MINKGMWIKKLYRVPFLAVVIGEIVLFLIILVTGNLGLLCLKPDLNPVLITLLVVVIGTLSFILLAFIQKYTYSPNRLKLNILIALTVLTLTIGLLLMNFTLTSCGTSFPSNITKDYLIDAGTIAFIIMTYHFVLFGLDVLISPSVEIRLNVAKLILDIILLTAYYLNFAASIAELIGRPVFKDLLNDIGDTFAYLLYILCAFYLAIMVFRSIILQRKATDLRGKAGFRSWAVTFFLIIIDIFLILLFSLVEEVSSHEADLAVIFGIGLLVVTTACSYFIYKGFIVPASTRPM